MKDRTEGWRQH